MDEILKYSELKNIGKNDKKMQETQSLETQKISEINNKFVSSCAIIQQYRSQSWNERQLAQAQKVNQRVEAPLRIFY